MDELPVEVVIHIVDFLSVRNVFQIMRTSRKLEEAARSVIRRKRKLALGCNEISVKSLKSMSCAMSQIDLLPWCRRRDDDACCKSLSQMVNLRFLIIQDCEHRFDLQPIADPVIRNNSRTLKQVVMDFDFSFPSLDNMEKYINLQKLFCWRLAGDEVIKSCPSLTAISCSQMSSAAINNLNTVTCTELMIGRLEAAAFATITKLTNVRTLHMELDDTLFGTPNYLFQSMKLLQEVKLTIHSIGNMDQMISSLCNNNPHIRIFKLCLTSGEIGNDSLSSMSLLHHLTKVSLDLKESNMTTTGLIKFLRGNSRFRLRSLRICIWTSANTVPNQDPDVPPVDRSVIHKEVLSINQESGRQTPLRFE
jgi:hypothetical protein